MSLSVDAVKLVLEWQKDPNSEFYIKPDDFEIENIKGFNGPINKYDGILLMNEVVNISKLKNFKLRNDDIFVIGFPKSGNLTFRIILNNMVLISSHKLHIKLITKLVQIF